MVEERKKHGLTDLATMHAWRNRYEGAEGTRWTEEDLANSLDLQYTCKDDHRLNHPMTCDAPSIHSDTPHITITHEEPRASSNYYISISLYDLFPSSHSKAILRRRYRTSALIDHALSKDEKGYLFRFLLLLLRDQHPSHQWK